MHEVSIIVLTYNSETYVSRCLASLKEQSFKNFEIIIVDGGSSDATLNEIEKFKKSLKLVVLKAPNSSMGEARNIAIAYSKSNFITFCDIDDVFLYNKLEAQLNHAKRIKSDNFIIFSNSQEAPNGDRKLAVITRDISSFTKKDVFRYQGCNLSAMLVKHDNTNPVFFEEGDAGRYGEDWQYNIELVSRNFEFIFLKGSFSIVDVRSNSHTTWQMQYLLKYYVLVKIISKKNFYYKYVGNRLEWIFLIFIHGIKFLFASVFCDNLIDFNKFKKILIKKSFVLKLILLFSLIIYKLVPYKMVKFFILLNRKHNNEKVKI